LCRGARGRQPSAPRAGSRRALSHEPTARPEGAFITLEGRQGIYERNTGPKYVFESPMQAPGSLKFLPGVDDNELQSELPR